MLRLSLSRYAPSFSLSIGQEKKRGALEQSRSGLFAGSGPLATGSLASTAFTQRYSRQANSGLPIFRAFGAGVRTNSLSHFLRLSMFVTIRGA